jgi:hypothetical protein
MPLKAVDTLDWKAQTVEALTFLARALPRIKN